MTITKFINSKIWRWESSNVNRSDGTKGHFISDCSLFVDTATGLITNVNKCSELDHIVNDNQVENLYDLGPNQVALPGIIDAHIHVGLLGESQYFVDLSNCYSIENLQNTLNQHIAKNPDLELIQGVNWDQTKLGRYPCYEDIDSVCSSKPVFLWRACWHIGVANSNTMHQAGFDRNQLSYNILGGQIDVDSNGATGIFRENAVTLISSLFTKYKSRKLKMKFIKEGLWRCAKAGLTCVQTNDELCYDIYKELEEKNEIPIRVCLTPCIQDMYIPTEQGGILDIKPYYGRDGHNSMLRIDRVKIFSDGSLGAETAALRIQNATNADYSHSGVLTYTAESLRKEILFATERGWRLEIHTIGDAAVEQVLIALEQVCATVSLPVTLTRPVLTHCQVLGEDLIIRMKRLGVIANIQPSFVPTDMCWVKDRLSATQQQYAYAWKTLLHSDVMVAGGSDAPVESCSPFPGLHDAMYRMSRTPSASASSNSHHSTATAATSTAITVAHINESKTNTKEIKSLTNTDASVHNSLEFDVYRPEECLSFSEALYLYTKGAAYASNTELFMGNISEGYVGDFVVVDDVPLTRDTRSLGRVKPNMVVVGGKVIYCDPNKLNKLKVDDMSDTAVSSTAAATHTTVDQSASSSRGTELKGPFIPGKNGEFRCACMFFGRTHSCR